MESGGERHIHLRRKSDDKEEQTEDGKLQKLDQFSLHTVRVCFLGCSGTSLGGTEQRVRPPSVTLPYVITYTTR